MGYMGSMQYEDFDETSINEREKEIVEKIKNLFMITKEEIDEKYNKIQIYFSLKEELAKAFGLEHVYVKELEKRGLNNFIQYVYRYGELPEKDLEKLKKLLPNIA